MYWKNTPLSSCSLALYISGKCVCVLKETPYGNILQWKKMALKIGMLRQATSAYTLLKCKKEDCIQHKVIQTSLMHTLILR